MPLGATQKHLDRGIHGKCLSPRCRDFGQSFALATHSRSHIAMAEMPALLFILALVTAVFVNRRLFTIRPHRLSRIPWGRRCKNSHCARKKILTRETCVLAYRASNQPRFQRRLQHIARFEIPSIRCSLFHDCTGDYIPVFHVKPL